MPKARLVFDGDNVYIGKDGRIYGLKNDIATKIDGIPGVIDNLSSTSTTDALSANMGRDLQDQINAMSGIGTFLSTWDCTTGLPDTNPQQDPYTYKVGDYYIVSTVGATNYKPHGGTFTQGVPSTTVETENVGINDKYYFDGADWVRIPNTAIQITIDTALSTSSTNAVENRAIANAVNAKQDIISDLNTIRTGASKGATAIQPNDNISQLTNNVGYQTAGDVASAIAGKQDILSAGDGISITSNTVTNTKPGPAISGTAPANPTEGMLWYDTVNDVLKSYDGANWNEVGSDAADINTKTFYGIIPGHGPIALSKAQEVLDWYLAGKNPIIGYNNFNLTLYTASSSQLIFKAVHESYINGNSYTYATKHIITIDYSSNVATEVSINTTYEGGDYLRTDRDYPSPYTPAYNGSPATKKYVDDSVSEVIPSGGTAPQNPQEGDLWYDTVNHVLKIYNGTSWETVDTDTNTTYTAGDNIQISAQNVISATDTIYTAGEGIEIGTAQDYSAIQGPAPEGFHIPTKNEWVSLCGILTTTFGLAGNATIIGTYLKMPMAGIRYYSSADINNVGVVGRYWSSTPDTAELAYDLQFSSSGIAPNDSRYRSYGFSVRCFKDFPIIPTVSWTTLYDGSSIATGAGIFYNVTDGLISVSGDGQTWYTIQDKNLGATTVFNQGDTETDANCGYFYQRGNNYGFTHSGAVTTSSTKIDASNYGPGNYYNSSTFITVSASPRDWSSAQNDNLWGGETGVVQLNNAITNIGVTSVNGQVGDVTVETGVPAGSTPPANPVQGQLWYDTVNGKLFVYDGTNWVELGTLSGLISGTTFGAFATACQASGSLHTSTLNKYYKSSGGGVISDRGTATYTMQGIGFFTGMGWSANSGTVSIAVNGLTIWSDYNTAGTYTNKYLNTPITLSPGDEVSVTMSQYGSGDISATISDFY